MLSKELLKLTISNGLKSIFKEQSAKATTEGAEQEDPEVVIDSICEKMATVVSDAIDFYVRNGDVIVGPSNIFVTSPSGQCTVIPALPARIT